VRSKTPRIGITSDYGCRQKVNEVPMIRLTNWRRDGFGRSGMEKKKRRLTNIENKP
jgi:hypothetical protein